ncbi:hypothetical protein C3L33_10140, partial [Rhododendron williamsianum]
MNIEEGKERGVTSTGNPPQPGVADYPPKPVVGFPQPGPPPVATYSSAPPPPPQFYADGNQAGPAPAAVIGTVVIVEEVTRAITDGTNSVTITA